MMAGSILLFNQELLAHISGGLAAYLMPKNGPKPPI